MEIVLFVYSEEDFVVGLVDFVIVVSEDDVLFGDFFFEFGRYLIILEGFV